MPAARPHRALRTGLLAAALDSVRADGEVFAFAAGPADSVKFHLWLTTAYYGEDGKLVPPRARAGFPVATLRVPPARRARSVNFVHPDFPSGMLGQSVGVNLTMRFVVDSTGNVDPAMIQDVWPEGVPRQLGGSATVYDAFVRAARRSILRSPFEPARIGPCMVPETVQMVFTGTARTR